jgi:hypothetical protein
MLTFNFNSAINPVAKNQGSSPNSNGRVAGVASGKEENLNHESTKGVTNWKPKTMKIQN